MARPPLHARACAASSEEPPHPMNRPAPPPTDDELHALVDGQLAPERRDAIEQALALCQTTIVQDAWERGQALTIHSLIYGIQDGLLRDLGVDISAPEELSETLAEAFRAYE